MTEKLSVTRLISPESYYSSLKRKAIVGVRIVIEAIVGITYLLVKSIQDLISKPDTKYSNQFQNIDNAVCLPKLISGEEVESEVITIYKPTDEGCIKALNKLLSDTQKLDNTCYTRYLVEILKEVLNKETCNPIAIAEELMKDDVNKFSLDDFTRATSKVIELAMKVNPI